MDQKQSVSASIPEIIFAANGRVSHHVNKVPSNTCAIMACIAARPMLSRSLMKRMPSLISARMKRHNSSAKTATVTFRDALCVLIGSAIEYFYLLEARAVRSRCKQRDNTNFHHSNFIIPQPEDYMRFFLSHADTLANQLVRALPSKKRNVTAAVCARVFFAK